MVLYFLVSNNFFFRLNNYFFKISGIKNSVYFFFIKTMLEKNMHKLKINNDRVNVKGRKYNGEKRS